jgi:hypothetical protein
MSPAASAFIRRARAHLAGQPGTCRRCRLGWCARICAAEACRRGSPWRLRGSVSVGWRPVKTGTAAADQNYPIGQHARRIRVGTVTLQHLPKAMCLRCVAKSEFLGRFAVFRDVDPPGFGPDAQLAEAFRALLRHPLGSASELDTRRIGLGSGGRKRAEPQQYGDPARQVQPFRHGERQGHHNPRWHYRSGHTPHRCHTCLTS